MASSYVLIARRLKLSISPGTRTEELSSTNARFIWLRLETDPSPTNKAQTSAKSKTVRVSAPAPQTNLEVSVGRQVLVSHDNFKDNDALKHDIVLRWTNSSHQSLSLVGTCLCWLRTSCSRNTESSAGPPAAAVDEPKPFATGSVGAAPAAKLLEVLA